MFRLKPAFAFIVLFAASLFATRGDTAVMNVGSFDRISSGSISYYETPALVRLIKLAGKRPGVFDQCIDHNVHCTPGGLSCCEEDDTCCADEGSSSTYCHDCW